MNLIAGTKTEIKFCVSSSLAFIYRYLIEEFKGLVTPSVTFMTCVMWCILNKLGYRAAVWSPMYKSSQIKFIFIINSAMATFLTMLS